MATTGLVAAFPPGIKPPMELREFPVPEPEPGAIVVKISRASVCGSDLHFWRGDINLAAYGMKEPTVLGHEMTGRVWALGSGVSTDSAGQGLSVGDRVVYRYFAPCGRCPACVRGSTAACGANALFQFKACTSPPHFVGGFGEYYYLQPRQAVFKVPDALGDEMVAGVNCALAEVIEGLERVEVGMGETVVVQGAGGLGLYATAVARHMGAGRVIVLDGVAERLSLAEEFGADAVIDVTEFADGAARARRVRELNAGLGAEVVCELVGFPEAVGEGIQMLGQGGRYLEIGNISLGMTVPFDPAQVTIGNKTIHGVAFYEPLSLKKALDLLVATKDTVPYEKLFAVTYPLEAINEAFADADSRRVTRASIVP